MSIEAEQVVIGAAISTAENYDAICQIIGSADFSDEITRCVWDANTAIREAGRDSDLVILSSVLNRSGRWQTLRAGDALDYVNALVQSTQGFASTMVYADIVKQASMARQLFGYSEQVKDISHNGDLSADQKLGEANHLLTNLSDAVPDGFKTYKQAVSKACDEIMAQIERGGDLSGLSTGFKDIDQITAGLQDSDLIYVGARPSMGKTMFMMNIANHAAKTVPVLVFSLEMPCSGLAKRSLSAQATINMSDIQRGNIDEHSRGAFTAAGKQLAELNMRIDDSAGISVDQIRTRARIAARKEKPRLILIDYLTMISGKGDTKHLEVSYISKSLKAMAKELECPVICLAQLNRGLESRTDKRPLKSDLRESGSIEEDADVVMLLYRDEVYDEESPRKGILEVNVAKNRNGEIGTRYLQSQLEFQRFRDLSTAVPALQKTQESTRKPKPSVADTSGGNY